MNKTLQKLKAMSSTIGKVITDLRAASLTMKYILNMDVRSIDQDISRVEIEQKAVDMEIASIQEKCIHNWVEEYGGCHHVGDYCSICGKRK